LIILPLDYSSILKKHKIDVVGSEVKVSYNTLIVINREEAIVHKCSLNEIGRWNVQNNYDFLKSSAFGKCPKPLSISELDGVVVGTESFLAGEAYRVEELDANLIRKVFAELKEMYYSNISYTTFDFEREIKRYDRLLGFYPSGWREALLQIRAKISTILQGCISDNRAYKTVIHGDLTYRNVLKH